MGVAAASTVVVMVGAAAIVAEDPTAALAAECTGAVGTVEAVDTQEAVDTPRGVVLPREGPGPPRGEGIATRRPDSTLSDPEAARGCPHRAGPGCTPLVARAWPALTAWPQATALASRMGISIPSAALTRQESRMLPSTTFPATTLSLSVPAAFIITVWVGTAATTVGAGVGTVVGAGGGVGVGVDGVGDGAAAGAAVGAGGGAGGGAGVRSGLGHLTTTTHGGMTIPRITFPLRVLSVSAATSARS